MQITSGRAATGGRALVLPCIAILLVYVVGFTAPQIVQTLIDDEGWTRSEAGLLMTSFSLAYCAGGLPAGRLTRRLGAGRVLVLGMLLAGLAAAASAAVPLLPVLVALRLVVGLATALALTAGIVRAVEALPPERRPGGSAGSRSRRTSASASRTCSRPRSSTRWAGAASCSPPASPRSSAPPSSRAAAVAGRPTSPADAARRPTRCCATAACSSSAPCCSSTWARSTACSRGCRRSWRTSPACPTRSARWPAS